MPAEMAIAGIILMSVTAYALLAGADFGAGIWEFNTALRAPRRERELLYHAIGPVWEANHVWLIFVLVGLWTAFPPAYAAISQALWVPLLLALVGIVFRGVGFAFRSYAAGAVRQQEIWSAVFALASIAAPFFLGASAGAVASGRLAVDARGAFDGNFVTGWILPLSLFGAVFGVGICAYLAGVYLTREALLEGDRDLAETWRRRSLATGAWMGMLAVLGLALVSADAPELWRGLRERAWPFVALSVACGIGSLTAVLLRRYTAAAFGAGGAAASVIWGWGVAQYPALIPPALTVANAKAPAAVLHAMLWVIAAGAVVLVPSLALLFRLFKGRRPSGSGVSPSVRSPDPSVRPPGREVDRPTARGARTPLQQPGPSAPGPPSEGDPPRAHAP
jgi:cytochrome d ubiquinol oxidase subunit II